jgi:cytoskeleton protein RodZ
MQKLESNHENQASTGVGLLGDYLKEKRIDKNYTLEKLSQKTKISVNILKALESNDYDHLPSAAYIKGFVTSYVKVLGLSLDEAINKMEYTYLNILGKPFPALNHTKLMQAATTQTASKSTLDEEEQNPSDVIESSESIIQGTKSILPLIIFGSIVLTFIGGYKLISSVVESEVTNQKTKNLGPKIESSSALVNKPAEAPVVKNQNILEDKQSADAATSMTTSEVKPEEVKATPVLRRNFPSIDFKPIKAKLFSVKTDAPENMDEVILPKKIKDSFNSELQNIYIKAMSGNTWLSYKIDSSPIESVIINQGKDLFLQGSEIRIFLGNVNVTKIFYNNYLIDTPTKNGVKSLVFPEESNSKYQMPLFPKASDDILYTSEDYIKRMKLEENELENKKVNQ